MASEGAADLEPFLKEKLGTQRLFKYGGTGKGFICHGQGYDTDNGRVFIKFKDAPFARVMFDGEYEGLAAIRATDTVYCPKPLHVLDNPNTTGAMLVMEFIDINEVTSQQAQLGEQIARLHLHNINLLKNQEAHKSSIHHSRGKGAIPVDQFGFHMNMYFGNFLQDNTWANDWMEFFVRQKLQQHVRMIEETYSDRDVMSYWPQVLQKVPSLFKGIEIQPSLLHGDLWSGNITQTQGKPVVFDPSVFYGHHEFDISISRAFGGFSQSFWDAYNTLIPKQPGFEKRFALYQLFHYLYHWNHFGLGYRQQSLRAMKSVIEDLGPLPGCIVLEQ